LLKKILIADDDSVTRGMLTRVLQSYTDRFEILNASDEYQALNLISLKNIDLLITDLQISHGDEYSFLTLISNDYPNLPVFVITAFGTPEIQKKIERIGKCRFFEKPLEMDTITESIFETFTPPLFEGRITGLRISSFFDLIAKEKKTCHLLVRSQSLQGELAISNGIIISAKTRNLKDAEAVHEIKSWKDSTIEILNDKPERTNSIIEPNTRPVHNTKLPKEMAKQNKNNHSENNKVIPPKVAEKDTQKEESTYSKHYSLTKDLIAQIENVEQPDMAIQAGQANGMKTAQAKPSASSMHPVLKTLKNDPNIVTYGIYDSHDCLHRKFSDSRVFEKLKPSVYRKLAVSLQTEISGGPFQCLVMKNNTIQHILFRYRKNWFFLVGNPDFQITRFIKKLTHRISI
jgi:CheY-like chemotaxis protein